MAMTPKGIYFPEGSTNADFISIFSTLAASIDAALGDFTYDSGWIDVGNNEMENGWTNYNSTGFRVSYRKIGKLVTMTGLIRYGTPNTNMFNMPSGFRPPFSSHLFNCLTSGVIPSGGGHKSTRVDVRPNGSVFQVGSNTALGNGFISLSGINYYTE